MSGTQLRESGLNATEITNEEFLHEVRVQAARVSDRRSSGYVSTDDLRVFADERGIKPQSSHAWGAVFRNGKAWELVGRKKSSYSSNHARWINVYRRRK